MIEHSLVNPTELSIFPYPPATPGAESSSGGFEGILTDTQKQVLEKLHQTCLEKSIKITDLNQFTQSPRLTLLRYLRANQFDHQKAIDHICKNIEWRKENNVDELILLNPDDILGCPISLIAETTPHWHCSYDKTGRPVIYRQYSKTDTAKLKQYTTIDNIIKYHIWEQEQCMKLCYEKSKKLNMTIETVTTVVDLKGMGMSQVTSDFITMMKAFAQIDQGQYPESLGRMLIINAPSMFPMVWRMFKPLLDVNVVAKFSIYGAEKEWKPALFENIGKENMPSTYGGDLPALSSEVHPYAEIMIMMSSIPVPPPVVASMKRLVSIGRQSTIHSPRKSEIEAVYPYPFNTPGRNPTIDGYMFSLTDEQQSILNRLIQWSLQHDVDLHILNPSVLHPSLTLLRYLRANKFDSFLAIEHMTKNLAWRQENKVKDILNMNPDDILGCPIAYITETIPHWHSGYDKTGRPVIYRQYAKMDTSKVRQHTSLENLMRYHIWEQEQCMKLCYERSHQIQHTVETTTTVVDLKGMGMSQVTSDFITIIKSMAQIDQGQYPESLGRMLIINAPSMFPMVWRIFKPMLDAAVVAKFSIYGAEKEWKPALFEYIGKENMPSTYGGDLPALSSEVHPYAESMAMLGKMTPSRYHIQNNGENSPRRGKSFHRNASIHGNTGAVGGPTATMTTTTTLTRKRSLHHHHTISHKNLTTNGSSSPRSDINTSDIYTIRRNRSSEDKDDFLTPRANSPTSKSHIIQIKEKIEQKENQIVIDIQCDPSNRDKDANRDKEPNGDKYDEINQVLTQRALTSSQLNLNSTTQQTTTPPSSPPEKRQLPYSLDIDKSFEDYHPSLFHRLKSYLTVSIYKISIEKLKFYMIISLFIYSLCALAAMIAGAFLMGSNLWRTGVAKSQLWTGVVVIIVSIIIVITNFGGFLGVYYQNRQLLQVYSMCIIVGSILFLVITIATYLYATVPSITKLGDNYLISSIGTADDKSRKQIIHDDIILGSCSIVAFLLSFIPITLTLLLTYRLKGIQGSKIQPTQLRFVLRVAQVISCIAALVMLIYGGISLNYLFEIHFGPMLFPVYGLVYGGMTVVLTSIVGFWVASTSHATIVYYYYILIVPILFVVLLVAASISFGAIPATGVQTSNFVTILNPKLDGNKLIILSETQLLVTGVLCVFVSIFQLVSFYSARKLYFSMIDTHNTNYHIPGQHTKSRQDFESSNILNGGNKLLTKLQYSRKDKYFIIWAVICALYNTYVNGTFCIFSSFISKYYENTDDNAGWINSIWIFLGHYDKRYLNGDNYLITTSGFEALFLGPLLFFYAWAIYCKAPYRHLLGILASSVHLHINIIFYAMSMHIRFENYHTENAAGFGFLLLGYLLFGLVTPTIVFYNEFREATRHASKADNHELLMHVVANDRQGYGYGNPNKTLQYYHDDEDEEEDEEGYDRSDSGDGDNNSSNNSDEEEEDDDDEDGIIYAYEDEEEEFSEDNGSDITPLEISHLDHENPHTANYMPSPRPLQIQSGNTVGTSSEDLLTKVTSDDIADYYCRKKMESTTKLDINMTAEGETKSIDLEPLNSRSITSTTYTNTINRPSPIAIPTTTMSRPSSRPTSPTQSTSLSSSLWKTFKRPLSGTFALSGNNNVSGNNSPNGQLSSSSRQQQQQQQQVFQSLENDGGNETSRQPTLEIGIDTARRHQNYNDLNIRPNLSHSLLSEEYASTYSFETARERSIISANDLQEMYKTTQQDNNVIYQITHSHYTNTRLASDMNRNITTQKNQDSTKLRKSRPKTHKVKSNLMRGESKTPPLSHTTMSSPSKQRRQQRSKSCVQKVSKTSTSIPSNTDIHINHTSIESNSNLVHVHNNSSSGGGSGGQAIRRNSFNDSFYYSTKGDSFYRLPTTTKNNNNNNNTNSTNNNAVVTHSNSNDSSQSTSMTSSHHNQHHIPILNFSKSILKNKQPISKLRTSSPSKTNNNHLNRSPGKNLTNSSNTTSSGGIESYSNEQSYNKKDKNKTLPPRRGSKKGHLIHEKYNEAMSVIMQQTNKKENDSLAMIV